MFKHRELLFAHILGWTLYGVFEHISHIVYGQNHWQGSFGGAMLGCLFTTFLAWFFEQKQQWPILLRGFLFAFGGFFAAIIWHNTTRFFINESRSNRS